MLPLKHWPMSIWVGVAALGLLLVHAIGLGIQLILVGQSGGMPDALNVPDAPLHAPVVDTYSAQVLGGFVPAIVILGLGLYTAFWTIRIGDEQLTLLARILLGALGLAALAVFALSLPWIRAVS